MIFMPPYIPQVQKLDFSTNFEFSENFGQYPPSKVLPNQNKEKKCCNRVPLDCFEGQPLE
jgi:hypothetical protein